MEHKIGDVFTMVEEDGLVSTFILFHIKTHDKHEPAFFFIDGNISKYAHEWGYEAFFNLKCFTKIT